MGDDIADTGCAAVSGHRRADDAELTQFVVVVKNLLVRSYRHQFGGRGTRMDAFTRSLSAREARAHGVEDDEYTDDDEAPSMSYRRSVTDVSEGSGGIALFLEECASFVEKKADGNELPDKTGNTDGSGDSEDSDDDLSDPSIPTNQSPEPNRTAYSSTVYKYRNAVGAFMHRQKQFVSNQLRSRKIRWVFDVTCGRYRSNYFYPLAFLVPVSICVTVFMWPLLLPGDLVQKAYAGSASAARVCMETTQQSVAPMLADAYIRNREQCMTDCPSPAHAAMTLCRHTSACGGEDDAELAALALDEGALFVGVLVSQNSTNSSSSSELRRKLLFGAGIEGLAQAGVTPELANEIGTNAVEATSACTACQITATQIFHGMANASNHPSPHYVEAMVRVHGREWCARSAANSLPPYEKWRFFRGITSWTDVGRTPEDDWEGSAISADDLLANNPDTGSNWPNTDGTSAYNPDAWNPNNCTVNITTMEFIEGSGNVPDVNCTQTLEDPPVNEQLMTHLMANSPSFGCPKTVFIDGTEFRLIVPAAFASASGSPQDPLELTPRPDWADTCAATPDRDTYGVVGETSAWSKEYLGLGSTTGIMAPAMILFPIFVLNGIAGLKVVEAPFVACSIGVLVWIFVDNIVALIRFLPCMDLVFIIANCVHLSIIGAAIAAAFGLIGVRYKDPDAKNSAYNHARSSWKLFMGVMIAGAPVAPFSVQRANVIVRGNARLLASTKVQRMLSSNPDSAIQKTIKRSTTFLKKLKLGKDPLRVKYGSVKKPPIEPGWLPAKYFGWVANSGLPKTWEKRISKEVEEFKVWYRGMDPNAASRVDALNPTIIRPHTKGFHGLNSIVNAAKLRDASFKSVSPHALNKTETGIKTADETAGAKYKSTSSKSPDPTPTLAGKSFRSDKLVKTRNAPLSAFFNRTLTGKQSDSENIQNMRSTPALMAIWREAVTRVMQAKAAQAVLSVDRNGTPSWRTKIPSHNPGFGSRMLLAIFGTCFITFICVVLSTQLMRKFVEVTQWSYRARWCTWQRFGIYDPTLINEFVHWVSYSIPGGTAVVIIFQLMDLAQSYRKQIQLLRLGKSTFSFSEKSVTRAANASEWVGYHLVLTGFTYVAVFVVLCCFMIVTMIPILAFLSIGPESQDTALKVMYTIVTGWILTFIGSQAYRQMHKHVFNDRRLNVIRYFQWFQLSDFVMLYVTMQRSFVVVIFRSVWTVLVQTACIMRSDLSFFPPIMGPLVDPPHVAYVAMVLSDWKQMCPIARTFAELLVDIGKKYELGRNRVLRETLLREGGNVGRVTRKRWSKHVDGDGKKMATKTFLNSLFTQIGGTSMKNKIDFQAVLTSTAVTEKLKVLEEESVRKRRARTRWFLAITLSNNPSLVYMRRPRGIPVAHRSWKWTRPRHLPHFVKTGWLRRRGGVMGLMGAVSDDYLVVCPGVLYIFEHDRSVVSKVYPLNERMTIRRLFVSTRDQTTGGWHFSSDYYLPGNNEAEMDDPETGDMVVDGDGDSGDDRDASGDTYADTNNDSDIPGDVPGDGSNPNPHGNQSSWTFYKRRKKWKLRDKHFFALTVPGGPMEIFAATSEEDANVWVELLRSEAAGLKDGIEA